MSSASEIPFIYDTDALAQIYIAGQQKILLDLREKFNVQSFLMMEVEVELLSNKRISGYVKPLLDKSLRNGWIRRITAGDLESLAIQDQTRPEVTLEGIRALAADLKLLVDNGEAHTHAAAYLLNTPAVSNDYNAIRTLENNAKPLPPTVLRAFDLFAFSFYEKLIDLRQGEAIRNELRIRKESLPAAMQNNTFEKGLPALKCRLSTSLDIAGGAGKWSDAFYLKRR